MKKSFIVLSLASLTLVGCSSFRDFADWVTNKPSSASTESTATADVNPSWQETDNVQYVPMQQDEPVVRQPVKVTAPRHPVPLPKGGQGYDLMVERVGNCEIARDAANKPVYAQMVRGCYTEKTYTVGRFDTFYLIGFLTGTNAKRVASLNGLRLTTPLRTGQVLRVR